jgi:4'-phosphopantetheinyl transferase
MLNSFESGSQQACPHSPPPPDTATYLADHSVEVVVARLDVEADALNVLAGWLRGEELQRACRFHFERDRRRFIVARGRLRQLLAARLGTDPRSIELAYAEQGKPLLAPGSAAVDWRFNVSHSRDLAVFAFCRGREVGIDVEAVYPVHDADAVAAHFFSGNELAAYRALDPRDREPGFFNCWTRKEAFVKALGDGLRHPLGSFDVSLAPEAVTRILRVGDTPGEDSGWCLRSFAPAPGYVAALVVERSRPAVNDAVWLQPPLRLARHCRS